MSYFGLLKNTIREFSEDDCTTRAAAIAYAAFFSIFPLLLGGIALASTFVDTPEARQRILGAVTDYLPGSGDLVRNTLQGVMQQRGAVGLVSTLLLLFSGRSIFVAIMHALSEAFETPSERGFISSTLLAIALIFGVGGLLLLSLVVTGVMQALGQVSLFGIGPFQGSILWTLLQMAVSILINFVMFLLLFRIAPNMHVEWREIVPGAVFAAVAFELLKFGFVIYVNNFASYSEVYGSIGAVIVLLTWCYFSSLILLLGAELSSEYLKMRRQQILEPTLPRPAPAITLPVREPLLPRAIALVGTVVALVGSLFAVRRLRGPTAG